MDCAYSVEPRDRPSHKIETHGVRLKVMKDGTTYENSFDIDINNSYSAKSNIVRVQTPKAQPIILPAAGGPGTLLPVTLLSVLAVVSGAAWLFTRRREVWRGAGAWYGREAYSLPHHEPSALYLQSTY